MDILEKYERLRCAATVLYTSGRWSTNGLDTAQQEFIWEELRAAADIPKGTDNLVSRLHNTSEED